MQLFFLSVLTMLHLLHYISTTIAAGDDDCIKKDYLLLNYLFYSNRNEIPNLFLKVLNPKRIFHFHFNLYKMLHNHIIKSERKN